MVGKRKIVQSETVPERTGEEIYSVPEVDIFETDDQIILMADVPGVGQGDLEVTVREGELVIEARPQFMQPKGARAVYREFTPNLFRRAFAVSKEVDSSKVEGSVSGGVLTVRLPKAEEARIKHIKIKSD